MLKIERQRIRIIHYGIPFALCHWNLVPPASFACRELRHTRACDLSARSSLTSCSCEGLLTLFFRHLLRSSDPRPAGPNAPTPTARPLSLPEIGYHTTWHSLSYKTNKPWKPLMIASNALGVIAPIADTSRRLRENLLRAMGASTAISDAMDEMRS